MRLFPLPQLFEFVLLSKGSGLHLVGYKRELNVDLVSAYRMSFY